MIKFVYSGEGFYSPQVNYQYLYDTYAKKLDKSMKEYLKLKLSNQQELGPLSYYRDGSINPSPETLGKWITEWSEFLENHPRFALKEQVQENIQKYTKDFIHYPYFYMYGYDGYLTKDGKKAYEDFLKNANPKYEAYKSINKAYKSLQSVDYKKAKMKDIQMPYKHIKEDRDYNYYCVHF